VAEGSVAGASLIASHLPGPLGTAVLHAAHDAYTVGMTDGLRVSAGIMVAGTLLIGMFMPARTQAAGQQPEMRKSARAEVAFRPSELVLAEEAAGARRHPV